MYVWIAGWAIAGIMPLFTLISFLTIPFAIIAIRGALHSSDMKQLMPALGNNVLTVLVTQLLLGIGYILATAL
jgi:1,4-dihydroxy-2-naphthoate octaprenyltransferase